MERTEERLPAFESMKALVKAAIVNSPREKICSRCHAAFFCGAAQADERCWCERLPHVPLIADERTDCFCSECLSEAIAEINAAESGPGAVANQQASLPLLREGDDYYVEGDAMVFTAAYHLRRGYCCNSSCRHCPYEQQPVAATQDVLSEDVSRDPIEYK